MIGIVLLAGYWLQGPLAFLVFSNKVLLKPGSTPRLWFLKGHVIAGKGLNMLGLMVIILGILAFEVKRPQWQTDNSWMRSTAVEMSIWYKFCRAGMVAFGLLVLLSLIYAIKPEPAPAKVNPIESSVDPLIASNEHM